MIALTLLVIFILYLLTAFFITRRLVKRATSTRAKWAIGTLSALVFFLIPTWDHLFGGMYFNYLCAKEGGIKIYKTMELGREYYLQPGEIDYNTAGRLPATGGELDHRKLGETFSTETRPQNLSNFFRIEKYVYLVREKISDQVLATSTRFVYRGGWLVNHLGAHVVGVGCPDTRGKYYDDFYRMIFKRI